MELRVACFIGIIFVSCATAQCPVRDEDEADRLDPGRNCRKLCVTNDDCKSVNKSCMCDDVCGMSCFNKDAECPALDGTLVNGRVQTKDGLTYGSTAKYSCDNGYYLDGLIKRKCRSDRMWSYTAPTCVRGCPPPNNIGNAFVTSTDAIYTVGMKAIYSCRTGFDHVSGELSTECRDDYTWSSANFLCRKKQCPRPTTLDHGSIEGSDYSFASAIIYKCDKGYDMENNPSNELRVRCRADATWSGRKPTCEPVYCGSPGLLENGVIDESLTNKLVFQEMIDYRCNVGYKLVGPSTGMCNEDRNWGEKPKCEIDPDCDFEKSRAPTCGYNSSGSLTRKFSTETNSGVGYFLQGKGKLRSMVYPIGDEAVCLKFEYKRDGSDGEIYVEAISPASPGTKKEVGRADDKEEGWQNFEARISRVRPEDKDVMWDIVIEKFLTIDNVKVVNGSECADVTTVQPTTTITSTTSTTTQASPTTVPITTVERTTLATTTTSTTSQEPVVVTTPDSLPPDERGHTVAPGTITPKSTTTTTRATSTTGREVPPGGLDTGVIVGIVLAVVLAVAILAIIGFMIYKKKRGKNVEKPPPPANHEDAEAAGRLVGTTNV